MVACRMNNTLYQHQPVLQHEVLTHLQIKPSGIYVDATFGRGGHAQLILKQLGPQGLLFAMDKDPDAISFSKNAFANEKRFIIRHGSYATLPAFLSEHHVLGKVDGILMDLGVSSPQLDDACRGFSFTQSGDLDMRMDYSRDVSAKELLATIDEKTLATLLWEYGEERHSRRIARAIIRAREETPITTTLQLAHIISKAHPAWQKGKHPATRCFQAIRIAVNHELDDLKTGLAHSLAALTPGGRLLVISFHSLEDRIVKHFMQEKEGGHAAIPARLPIKHQVIQNHFKRVGRAIKPSVEEVSMNPRARSAVLRVGEKLS